MSRFLYHFLDVPAEEKTGEVFLQENKFSQKLTKSKII